MYIYVPTYIDIDISYLHSVFEYTSNSTQLNFPCDPVIPICKILFPGIDVLCRLSLLNFLINLICNLGILNMTVVTEVCEAAVPEVVGIEEKSGLVAGSFRDISNSGFCGIGDHEQANDPENSYVLVTGVDDAAADDEDLAAADASPRREASAPVEISGLESHDLKGKLEGVNAGTQRNLEGGYETSTIVDGGGDKDTVIEENNFSGILNEPNEKFDVNREVGIALTEEGNGNVATAEENLSVEKGVNGEVGITLTEGGEGNVAIADEKSVENGGHVGLESSVQDGDETQVMLPVSKPECRAEAETKKAEDSNGDTERSKEGELAKLEDQNGDIGVGTKAEPDKVEDQLLSGSFPGVKENQKSKFSELELVADLGKEPFNKQEIVEDEAASASGEEATEDEKCDVVPENRAIEDQKCDIAPEISIQCRLENDKVVESTADCHVGTTGAKVLEGKDEEIYPDDVIKQHGIGATTEVSLSEREAGVSGPTQNVSDSSADVHRATNEVHVSGAETVRVICSSLVEGSESEIFGNGPTGLDSLEKYTVNGVSSESNSMLGPFVSNDKEPALQGSESSGNSEDDRNPPVSSVKVELDVQNSSAADHVPVTSDKDAIGETKELDSFLFDNGVSKSTSESANVKDSGDELDGATEVGDKTLLLTENGDTRKFNSVNISMASPESTSDAITGQVVNGVTTTKSFTFYVRIPRYTDEQLQEQIRKEELEVKEKTSIRDSIHAQIQEIRAKNQCHGVDYDSAMGEDRSVKKLLKEKRIEIDSLQNVISKTNNVVTFEDLNSRIKGIEHKMQHETLHLNEEKQFVNEIKHLKRLREQLSSSMGNQNDIEQALRQREHAEDRLKILRKELGNLKARASKVQTASNEAESKYGHERKKVLELQDQFKAADDVRQEAYAKMLVLSKQLSQKRKNFYKFKNDITTAKNYAFSEDVEGLSRHCVNEVENFMELWNGNEELRKEYVRLNEKSTLRRFGTLDGRSLGPNEIPSIPSSYVSERNDRMASMPAHAESTSKSPAVQKPQRTHSGEKAREHENGTVGNCKQVNNLANVSGMDEVKKKKKKELELMKKAEEEAKAEAELKERRRLEKEKEERELIRKAKEEAEAKLKEQRRLEELAKAKEAREKKKRREEKAQKREELRAKKEAEVKEKEREKKLRKKERQKAAAAAAADGLDVENDTSSTASVEISKEVKVISTKPKKNGVVESSKQSKKRSAAPPSLRNRHRRKWQQWMWVILISLLVIVLFWLVFSNVNSKHQAAAGL